MHEIAEEEYLLFLQDMKDGAMILGRYVDESEYEDEYSHNEIRKAQGLFIEMVRTYLHENYPGKFVVKADGYCVFIVTPQKAKEHILSEETIQAFTVN